MNGPLWTATDILKVTGGRPAGSPPDTVNGLSIDSRTIREGEAFFAIRGDRFDGHDFVGRAFSAGGSLAVVDDQELESNGGVVGPLVVVNDVAAALTSLAIEARARTDAEVVAITGSAGKTTTKDMLGLALSASGQVHSAPASFNNKWGVSLSLARMPATTGYGVFEIGMNSPGEIGPLAKLVRPQLALITTVAEGHLGAFAGIEAIAREKAEIFNAVEPGGSAVLPRDNEYFDLLRSLAMGAGVDRIVSFGRHPEADVRLERSAATHSGMALEAQLLGRPTGLRVSAFGSHMAANALAVLGALSFLGADIDAGCRALAGFAAGVGRGNRTVIGVSGGSALMIDDSYNANPASMRAALKVLGDLEPGGVGRRVAVLGDMLELGENEAALHAGLASLIAEAGVDRVYLVGPRMEALWQALPPSRRGVYAGSSSELSLALADDIGPGDVVMIKGSNAIGLSEIVATLMSGSVANAKAER